MKKTVVSIFSFAFLFIATGVMAQGKTENKFDKPSEAKNVQISEKKVISELERKNIDAFEKSLKGKSGGAVPILDMPEPTFGGSTGKLGDPLPFGGQRYAIVIGLANYAGKVNDLCVTNAKTGKNVPTSNDGLAEFCKDQDALNMERVLTGKNGEVYNYGYDPDKVYRLSDSEATFDKIKATIDLVKRDLTPNDELVFFFSGHSATGTYIDETGYDKKDEMLDEAMVIYDQDYNETAFLNNTRNYASKYRPGNATYIWDDQLVEWLKDILTSRVVFIFDTCKAGGMNDLKSDGGLLAMSSTELESSYTYYLGGFNNGTIENPIYKESEGLFAHYFVRRAMLDELGDGFNPLVEGDLLKSDNNVTLEEAFNYVKPIIAAQQSAVLNDRFIDDLLLGY